MKPVAIFRFVAIEGPGFLSEFLDARKIPWQLIAVDEGDSIPGDASDYAGLVFMGGPMSVNDDLPWIQKSADLIREAFSQDIPLLGHCLGGQLMSKALGGVVSRNHVKEIGWGNVTVSDNEVARSWFGDLQVFPAFHWHGETFSIPEDAIHLLSSPYCTNQAWSIGKHVAFQCHVEMTRAMIEAWCNAGKAEVDESRNSPAVFPVSEILLRTGVELPNLKKVASTLYSKWVKGLQS